MSQAFQAGDFLVFQLEAGFALLRILEVEESGEDNVWHLAAYEDLFPDVETAERASGDPASLSISNDHIALTTRAFESTQVARISNSELAESETVALRKWKNQPNREISDRSVRLMLGLR